MASTFLQELGIVQGTRSRYVPSVPQCHLCKLDRSCRSPKIPVAGRGRKKVLVLGEAPGHTEDETNKPFVGKDGKLFQSNLQAIGIDLFRDCWATNSIICRPPDNRTPTDLEVAHCLPNLVNTLRELDPVAVILLGGVAIKSLIGWLWKEQVGAVGRWVGWQIPSQKLNAWVCPTWHPSFLAREQDAKRRDYRVIERYFRRHLKRAFGLAENGRPWKEVPDYASQVKVIIDPTAAAQEIVNLCRWVETPVAFDIETDRLKPDHPEAFIYSASLSSGNRTISYPWVKETEKATAELLAGPTPKIGYNVKFETRWLARFRHRIRNWKWDGMLAAHVLDNRPDICGLKFQAFVLLGQDSYDEEIKPYLKSSGGANTPNRIKEAPLKQLLQYGGLDALLEWHVAKIQAEKLGVEL